MRTKVLLSWRLSKYSAWALHILQERTEMEGTGSVTTPDQAFKRVAYQTEFEHNGFWPRCLGSVTVAASVTSLVLH